MHWRLSPAQPARVAGGTRFSTIRLGHFAGLDYPVCAISFIPCYRLPNPDCRQLLIVGVEKLRDRLKGTHGRGDSTEVQILALARQGSIHPALVPLEA